MAARRTMPRRQSSRGTDRLAYGDAGVVRRAPFSDNPYVGPRGQRTQQRILDAALRAFGAQGYNGCSIDRIARLSGCSRVSFYQYFASKEDVFRYLVGQVVRQVSASTEALDPLTPDVEGWGAMRAWVARYAEIYARYEPVFHAYHAAVESDEAVAAVVTRTNEENLIRIHSRLVATKLPSRQLGPVIRMLLACLNHTLDVLGILRSAAPNDYPVERVELAVTDVLHRTLFGVRPSVNVHSPGGSSPTALDFTSAMQSVLRQDDESLEPNVPGKRTLTALLDSGREVFVSRGYHSTRVDDLAAVAGVSHGAFYRYFRNKDELARILTARAMRAISATLFDIPDLIPLDGSASRGGLRKWLHYYNAVHANEAAMLRVWVDATLQDPALRAESAPPLDWGRRQMARYLRPRGFGDIDMDAAMMVALLGVYGTRQRSAAEVEATAHIIESGLLGR